MKEKLKNLINEDPDLRALFASLYADLQIERTYRELQLSEKHLKARLRVPIKDQTLWLQSELQKKEIIFSIEELASFVTDWGQKTFNWLLKENG